MRPAVGAVTKVPVARSGPNQVWSDNMTYVIWRVYLDQGLRFRSYLSIPRSRYAAFDPTPFSNCIAIFSALAGTPLLSVGRILTTLSQRFRRADCERRGGRQISTDGGELLAEVSGRFRLPEPPCPPGAHPKVMQEPAGH